MKTPISQIWTPRHRDQGKADQVYSIPSIFPSTPCYLFFALTSHHLEAILDILFQLIFLEASIGKLLITWFSPCSNYAKCDSDASLR